MLANDPVLSSLEDAGFMDRILDNWTTDFLSSGSQTPCSDLGDDATMILSQHVTPDIRLARQNPTVRSFHPHKLTQYSSNDDSMSLLPPGTPSAVPCGC